jgi:ligand-binding sensor domain-containing protein/two-component sensor histidine kinase
MKINILMKIKIFLFCVLFIPAVAAQVYAPYVEHLSIEQGLFRSSVNCIIQDKRGFIWLGTTDGLVRYDGYNFQLISTGTSGRLTLPDNNITAIAEDNNGNIWLGSSEGYLCRYSPLLMNITSVGIKTNPVFTAQNEPPFDVIPVYSQYSSKSITSILCSKSGDIWAGTFGSGLFRYFPGEKRTIHYFYTEGNNSISSDYILSLAEDKTRNIWIGTYGGGLNRLTGKYKNGWETGVRFTSYLNSGGNFNKNIITSLLADDNTLWAGSYSVGLFSASLKIKPDSLKFNPVVLQPGAGQPGSILFITNIKKGTGGSIWIAEYGHGLFYRDQSNKILSYSHAPLKQNSLNNNNIADFLVDKSGIVWAAAINGYGINKLNPDMPYFTKEIPRINKAVSAGNSVTAFAENTNGEVWVGTLQGLNRIDKSGKVIDTYINEPGNINSLSGNDITSLLFSKSGMLWVGTANSGLNLYNKAQKSFTHFRYNANNKSGISSNRITSAAEDKNGTIWIGTSNEGLNRVIVKNGSVGFKVYKSSELYPGTLPGNNIRLLYTDSGGNLNVITRNGFLCTYNYSGDDFTTISLKDIGIKAEVISAYTSKDFIFLGTAGDGIYRLNGRTNKITGHFFTPLFRNKTIVSILPNGADLWLGTNSGIIKFSTSQNSFTLYNTKNNLQGMKFYPGACLRKTDGTLFFGGTDGYNFFNPLKYYQQHSSSVFITEVKVSDEEIPFNGNTIYLSEYRNSIQVSFSQTDYSDPLKNVYLYKLSGADKKWKYAVDGIHSISYTDLSPGSYTLYIKGINSDGMLCSNAAFVNFEIYPVFWKTWWFISLAILLITGSAAFFIYLRIHNYLEVEKLKSKLSADLHDTIGSGLTEIALLSDISQMEHIKNYGTESQPLQNISSRSRELIDNMSDIVWLVNPRPRSMYDLLVRLKEIYYPVLSGKGIKFNFDIPDTFMNIKLGMDERQNIYLIFKEALNNSIKYSGAGHISLAAEPEDESIIITLKDDGKGFNPEIIKGNGITNMRSRSAELKGDLQIISSGGSGTSVSIKVKL